MADQSSEKLDVISNPKSDAEADAAKAKESASLKSYTRIFSYADLTGWVLNIVALLCACGSGAILPLMDLILGKSVTAFTNYANGASDVDQSAFKSRLTNLTLWFVYLFIAKFVLTYVWSFALSTSALRTSRALRIDFLKHTLRQDVGYFDKEGTGSISIQVTTNCNLVNQGISEKLGLGVQGISTFVTAFIVAFAVQWKLTLITLAIVPVIMIVISICVVIDVKQEGRILPIYARAGQLAEEVIASMKTVAAFWAAPRLSKQYLGLLQEARKEGLKKSPNFGAMFSTEYFCIHAGYALAFWQGVRMYASGEITSSGDVVTVIFAVVVAATSLTQVAPQLLQVSKAASAADGLFKTIDRTPVIDSLSELGKKPIDCIGDVELRDIHFAYPSRPDVKVLKGLSLVLPANKTTAIVGPSGSGKSTIVGLLERWYNASEGQLLLDGQDIASLNIAWLRSNIRLVQQEPVLFNATVFQNVAYGLVGTPHENSSKDEQMRLVEQACRSSFAHEFIANLPEGYLTHVGERAGRLSGGQKQRIAIARSIISSPRVLLLDEATSALDPKAERIVQEALDNVSAERATLIIAHKLSTVKKADNIAVMSDGFIVEQGTHEELAALPNGHYAKLLKLQDLSEQSGGDYHNDDHDIGEKFEDESNKVMRLMRTEIEAANNDALTVDASKATMNYGILKCLWILLREQKHQKWSFLVIFITCILGGICVPAVAVIFAKLIAVFQLPQDQMVAKGDFYALMFFIIAIGILIVYFTLGWLTNIVCQDIILNYRLQMFKDVLNQDLEFFDKPDNTTGSIVSRLSTQPTQLQDLLGMNVSLIIIGLVTILASSILAIAIGWRLGLTLALGVQPVTTFFGYLRIRLEMKLDDEIDQKFADSASLASEAVSAIRTVASLALERTILEQYSNSLQHILSRSVKSLLWTMFWLALTHSINLLSIALGLWYGSQLLAQGEYTTEQFFIVFTAILLSGEAVAQFFMFTTSITKGTSAANYILWLHSLVPTMREKGPDHEFNLASSEGINVNCTDLEFNYPLRRDAPVLRGISVDAKPGQSLAFVGASGCGKTTMISLLERFYDPITGSIRADEQDIKAVCPRRYRSNLAIVQQEPTLYQLSIRENIALGLEGDADDVTENLITDACKKANIFTFITSLPDGLSTLCGKSGTQLSGGQRQRIAIARALIRCPKLLLLDEATSALDTHSEKLVQEALREGSERCTTIAVAHRLSTIKDCDGIHVFHKGRIVESGSHVQLLAKRGMYYEMCLGQSLEQAVE